MEDVSLASNNLSYAFFSDALGVDRPVAKSICCMIRTVPRLETGTKERLWAVSCLLRNRSTGFAGVVCLGG